MVAVVQMTDTQFFSALTAIKALKNQNIPHARCVVIIEASEESGSPDLDFYVEKLKDKIGNVSLVVCLDSSCGNYERLWLTVSLRGNITATLKVQVLTEGVHSGASGVIPSSFRILRILLDRIEDSKTGRMLEEAYSEIPAEQKKYAKNTAETLGDSVLQYPFVSGMSPVNSDITECILARTWSPTLCVIGASGLPTLTEAGNVLRKETSVKLSIRTPPNKQCKEVVDALTRTLTSNPPYGAKVEFIPERSGNGWAAPAFDQWLEDAINKSSEFFYGKDARMLGEGGSIPFMGMLGEQFPSAQFVVLGVLGPGSNAHGPNEFLDIDFAKNLTCCVSSILHQHYRQQTSLKRKTPDS